jgi:hypothetical protein
MSINEKRKQLSPIERGRISVRIKTNNIGVEKDHRGWYILDEPTMQRVLSSCQREPAKLFVKNCMAKMFGTYEFDESYYTRTNYLKEQKSRGLSNSYFNCLKNDYYTRKNGRGFHKYRYWKALGDGDVVKGFDKYVSLSKEIADAISENVYEWGSYYQVARRMFPEESTRFVGSISTMVANSIISPDKGFNPDKFRKLRKLIKRLDK